MREFSLVESILWDHCCGFWLLPEHLARLSASAAHFDFQYDENALLQKLDTVVKDLGRLPHKIHVLVNQNGEVALSSESAGEDRTAVHAGLAKQPIDTGNIFLYHKTTQRQAYDEAAAGMPEYDEVLLWNSKGEITESCTSNIVVELAGQYYTPPVSCGLLPGTCRARLLQEGRLIESPVAVDQLQNYTKIYLINSVIGWREVNFNP